METQATVGLQATGQTSALFSPPDSSHHPAPQSASVEAARAAAEVQAMMVLAKQFPRDEMRAFNRIMAACKRPSLAERALYAYRRGGSIVSGPSIRLAEVIAAAWGNMLVGVKEAEQRNGESTMIAFAWDVETNLKEVREFIVPHARDTKQGRQVLTDHRDIYELTANMAARRKRAAILTVVPGDVVEAAVEQCKKTQEGDQKTPLIDRIRLMVVAFGELQVSQEMIEKRIGHPITAAVPTQLIQLKQIYASLRDGISKREDWFELAAGGSSAAASDLTQRLKGGAPAAAKREVPTAKAEPVHKPVAAGWVEPPPED